MAVSIRSAPRKPKGYVTKTSTFSTGGEGAHLANLPASTSSTTRKFGRKVSKQPAELLPEPKLNKKARQETYQIVNKAMQPLLKFKGFRSLAELKHNVSEDHG